MKSFHYDSYQFRKNVNSKLKKIGIDADVTTGLISYNNSKKMELKCSSVYLLRHGRTQATMDHQFMSDTSKNSHIIEEAIRDLCELKPQITNYKFDVVVVCSDIPRVVETANIFELLNPELKYDYQKKYKGINNEGWEYKSASTLTGIDLNDYKEREEKHNIFAKSSNGESWAQVLLNTISLINYLNKNYADKRVLLISQGSILQGLRIITGASESPWEDYDIKKLYNLNKKEKRQLKSNYASINCLYDKSNINLHKLKKEKVGVVHGRFQVLHYGHMEYILDAKRRCDYLIIGICNPEIELTKYNKVCPHRSKISANPMTYHERKECIKGALIEAGVPRNQFDIVPFPINFPHRILNYAPSDAKYYMTIFEDWGNEKERILREELGLDVEVIKRGTFLDKKQNSTEIRAKIYRKEDWKDTVPNFVYNYIINHHIDERIKVLLKADHDKEIENIKNN